MCVHYMEEPGHGPTYSCGGYPGSVECGKGHNFDTVNLCPVCRDTVPIWERFWAHSCGGDCPDFEPVLSREDLI